MDSLADARQVIEPGLEALGITVAESQLQAIWAYLQQLALWNKTYNLTAVRDVADMVVRHILDSASINRWVEGGQVLDAGTGAGLPGVILAILEPARQVVLVDSSGKKIRFLRHIKRHLSLTNIEPVRTRVESYQSPARFSTVTARAWTSLSEIVLKAGPLCTQGGIVLAMKGTRPTEELQEPLAGFAVEAVHSLVVPGLDAQRHAIILRRNNADAEASV